MSAYPLSHKETAIKLRKLGKSLNEISQELNIAKSTASLWVRDVDLSSQANMVLCRKIKMSMLKTQTTKKQNRQNELEQILNNANESLEKLYFSNPLKLLLCSFLFWTEGEKDCSRTNFINSDPDMIRVYLHLLRNCLEIDERKFRAVIHMHQYHDKDYLLDFWSKITKINKTQFSKPYLKPNTGKRKRPGYMGCISIRYYDYKVALLLKAIYNTYVSNYIGA
ncbi:MAG: hypothetical protein JW922_09950 [Paludibacteraceae bacterium]|nr:hypothetical protein [Paludibacteraceae bacterium]